MRHTLIFQLVTAAGAGQYAAPLIWRDGQAVALAGYLAPGPMAIVSLKAMGALGTQFTLNRSGHVADPNVFPCLADTLADAEKTIHLSDLLDGAGIELILGETLALLVTVTGNATITIAIELDDTAPRVNTRSFAFAGANAAVAFVPTETGANIPAGLSATARYRMKGLFMTSTTLQHLIALWNAKGAQSVQAIEIANALLSGVDNYAKLTIPLTGTGQEFVTDFQLWLTAVAADAAAVQLGWVIFETN